VKSKAENNMGKACPDHDETQPGCIHCTNIAKIRERARAGKIELASQVLVEDVYVKEMETVRDALDAISNNSWGGALLTDLSSVADFRLEGETLRTFSKLVGVDVDESDTFVEICRRMRDEQDQDR
jgi:hypothetical protein